MTHFIWDTVVVFLAVLPAFGLFLCIAYALYFAPHRDCRRRMPPWLIVAVLMAFLILPKVDVVYALTRLGNQGEQAA